MACLEEKLVMDDGTVILTKEMEEEERQMKEENRKEEQQLQRQMEEKVAVEKELLEQRHNRLMHLLTKSQFYSQYLLQKIQGAKQEEPRNKNKRKRLKVDGREDKENSGCENSQESSTSEKSENERISEKSLVDKETVCANTKTKPKMGEDSILRESQPKLLENGTMRPYQLDGYSWLKTLFENGVNGILADEMGLGKTIQCIALLCHLVYMGMPGPFLIVAPLSTLPNWMTEFKRFAPKIPTLLYHGTKKERMSKRLQFMKKVKVSRCSHKCCPVVITSFEVAIKDANKLKKVFWRYLAVDEGHRLKNYKCLLARTLCAFSTVNRLILTGTPLQNNLTELWSLLHFLLPDIFDNLDVFESWFEITDMMEEGSDERIVQQEREKQIVSTLHKILNPFLLRRVKVDVDLEIPSKKELLVYVPMTQTQLDLYKATITRNFSPFEELKKPEKVVEYDSKGRPKRNAKLFQNLSVLFDESESDEAFDKYLREVTRTLQEESLPVEVDRVRGSEVNWNLRNIMMQCRKIVNHPYLVQYPLTPEGDYKIDDGLLKNCGKLQVLDQVLDKLHQRDHKVLLFSQMTKVLDIIEDYLILRPHFKYKRLDGGVRLEDRTKDIDEFNNEKRYFLYLLTTRAGGLGINLTSADTVIIYDSDWNPQQDLQAQDRCHRIGQTKPVLILRLVAASTVDEKMVDRAATKRKLEKVIMKSDKFKSCYYDHRKIEDKLDLEELLRLLQSRDHQRIHKASTGNGVFSENELDQLLDRSDLERDRDVNMKGELEGVFRTIPDDNNLEI